MTRPRTALIGQTAQPVRFAEMLVGAGHELVGICSPDAALKECAEFRAIPHFCDLPDFGAHCARAGIDYLFSIVNLRIVPRHLLEIPARLAINYHDGPLPRYAGVNATTWALLNQEKEHGITWHVMEEGPDMGDILKQVPVPIARNETAATLNMKCYFAAIRSFRVLLGELRKGTVIRTPQNLADRTYFGKNAVLPEVDESWSSDQVDAYRRALDFGTSPNPFEGRIPYCLLKCV